MNVAQAVGRALGGLGVDRVFGVVGSGNFAVTVALCESGAKSVAARHETGAVAMADGYARVSGGPGVASVHQGPGFTNALTGLIEATKAGSPVLLLAAETPASWLYSNFRIDQAAMAEAAAVPVIRITSAANAVDELERAWQQVTVDRRATILLLPLDVQGQECAAFAIEAPPAAPPPRAADESAAMEAVALLRAAERPVIIAGHGAVVADAGPALRRLAVASGGLLATSLSAHGLFADDPFSLGISGGFATDLAVDLVRGADVIVAVGASLNRWTMRHGRMVGETTRLIHVDSDPSRLGAQTPVDVGIVADARLAAETFATMLEADHRVGSGYRTQDIAARIAGGGWRDLRFADRSTGSTIDPRTATITCDEILPRERTLVLDGGHFSGWPVMYLSVPDAHGFVPNQSFQSIGLGIASAIGASFARPDRLAVAAVGDGGAFMALGELETTARLAVPLVVLVYNDDAYGAEVHHFGPDGFPLDTVRFGPTDIAAIARSMGAEGITVRAREDVARIEEWLPDRRRPLVVDIKVTPDVVGAWLPEAFRA